MSKVTFRVMNIPAGFLVGCKEEVIALVRETKESDNRSRYNAIAQFPVEKDAEQFALYLQDLQRRAGEK